MNNDELILSLIKAKKEGLKIMYGNIGFETKVEENHAWNLEYNYRIVRPREYIICIPRSDISYIEKLSNTWTRSDFGKTSEGNEFILMREVFKEDMK